MPRTADNALIRQRLRRWYAQHGRHDLPWRLTRDPYAILVSEVMLQQTQVSRVLPYFREWVERWPTIAALASADTGDVIRAWAGLGYNGRALRLQQAAQAVNKGLPRSVQQMRALPGVGEYTAAAVASFAFGQCVAVVDTNVARVLARVVGGTAAGSAAQVRTLAAELLPTRGVRGHNLALMDLGALICTGQKPRCGGCPVRDLCRWRLAGQPSEVRTRRPSARFADTARFARGRIIDALRASQGTCPFESLEERLPSQHREQLPRYLAALEREGLAVRHADGWALPSARMSATAG